MAKKRSGTQMPFKSNKKLNPYNSTSLPGKKRGMSLKQAKLFTEAQIKTKGFNFAIPTGSNVQKLTLPNIGSMLLGIAWRESFDGTFTFKINNETVHEDIHSQFATAANNSVANSGSLFDTDWFPINRLISGSDDIVITTQSGVQVPVANLIVYYQ